MSTFSSNSSKPSLVTLIAHDLDELPQKSVPEVYMVVKTMLKALTGRPHEYTMEEALFILREEKLISDVEYEELKHVVVSLIFYKYATHYDVDAKIDFDALKRLLLSAAEKSEVTIETYAQMRKNPLNFPDNATGHDLIKQHKKELYETEQKLLKEMSLSNKANINFPDFFTKVTEMELGDLLNQHFDEPKWKEAALELHVKYQLVKGKSLDWIIEQYVKTRIPENEIRKVLHDNRYYLKSLEDIFYMKDIILVTLAFTFSLLTHKELDLEEHVLEDLGYKKDHIDFVREQIVKRLDTI